MSGFYDRERDAREAREDAQQTGDDRVLDDLGRVPAIPDEGHDGSETSQQASDRLIDSYVDHQTRARLDYGRDRESAGFDLPAHGNPHGTLTAAELDVLSRLSHGKTKAEVAADIGRGEDTVKKHAQNASRKLETRSTLHACCQAIRQGLIE